MNRKEVKQEKPIQIKTTEEEYNLIKDKADSLGLSVSAYVRLVAIHSKISITVDDIDLNK